MALGLDLQGPDLRGAALLGFGLALGAALLYALAAMMIKRLHGVPAQLVAPIQVSLGVLLLLPLADFTALPVTPMPWLRRRPAVGREPRAEA